jgi:NAD(P)-dependent dehydrogenase (short-subunit alcohol dehydrogenase family)
MTKRLQDQVVLVTGGGKGIGKAVALAMAEEGAQVVVCGRHLETLQPVVAQIEQKGTKGLAVQANVADENDVNRVVEAALNAFGSVDVLVNNAGIGDSGPIHEQDIARWDEIIAVNLRGAFLMTRAVLPSMRQRRKGHVINISSEAGLYYIGVNAAYSVSKYALNGLTDCTQGENQAFGIRANAICPGMVITDLTREAPGLIAENCLSPEEVADIAVWLVTQPPNVQISEPVLVKTMLNPWKR